MSYQPSVVLRGVADSNNSSTTVLTNGQTFTGTATEVRDYASVVVACKTDRDGSLYVDFSPDGTNWDSTLTFTVTANTNEVHRISVTRQYCRVRFTNSSGSDQTFFRLQTLLGNQTALTSSLNSTVSSDADSIVSRSVLMGQTGSGSWQFVPVTNEGHLEVAVHSPRLPMGSVHAENILPVFQTDAVYGINPLEVTPTSSGSGAVSASNSAFTLSSGTTIYSQAILQSRKRLRYRAGQGSICRFSSAFTTPVASSYQVAGLGHSEDGFYFGYQGTQFGILYVDRGVRAVYTLTVTVGASAAGNVTITLNGTAYTVAVTNSANIQRTVWEIAQGTFAGWKANAQGATVVFVRDAAGTTPGAFSFSAGATGSAASIAQTKAGAASTDTFIPQSSWNGDTLDGTGASGITLVPTNFNVFQIGMQYGGSVIFGLELTAADGNNPDFIIAHTIKQSNTSTATPVGNPSFPFTAAVYSAGSTTDLTLKIGFLSGFTEGMKRMHGPRLTYFDAVVANTTTYTPAYTILNPRYFGGRTNQGVINFVSISLAQQHNNVSTVYLIRNGTLSGNPNFQQWSSYGMGYRDNAATAVTVTDNSQILWSGQVSGSGNITYDFTDELTLQPGEWLSVCARSQAGTPSVVSTLNTREDQ